MFEKYFGILGKFTLKKFNNQLHKIGILPNKTDHTILKWSILFSYILQEQSFGISIHAVKMQAPPTFLIFSSAIREKNLALTITGCLGKAPLPKTLK